MKYCHGCLKRIWFWESRAEGCHIKCLPIEERCKYYHIQRDISTSAFFGVMAGIAMFGSTNSISMRYVGIGIAVCVFFVSGFITYKIREREKRMKEEDKIKLIENLEDIKDKKSVVIDETEALLIEWKKDQERLANLLISLKSKVKNDEETK